MKSMSYEFQSQPVETASHTRISKSSVINNLRGVLDSAAKKSYTSSKERGIKMLQEEERPEVRARKEISKLYMGAYRAVHNPRHSDYSKAYTLRMIAERKLAIWRNTYPEAAAREAAEKELRKNKKEDL